MSSALYGLMGWQSFGLCKSQPCLARPIGSSVSFAFGAGRKTCPDAVVGSSENPSQFTCIQSSGRKSVLGCEAFPDAGSIPARRFMPGDTDTGDTIFESEENLEQEQSTGRQPLFSSPGDQIAGWMEQDREGNWYISCQINFFGQSFNVPLFVNDDREDARQYINKVGQALTD